MRHNKTMFTYGNYDQYYKQRHDRCATVDPRIEALLRAHGPDLFSRKVVLDLGCNAGFVSFLVASMGAARVEGVDIDLKLVGMALKQLRRLKQEGHQALPTAADGVADDARFPVSLVHCRGIVPYTMKPLMTKSLSAPVSGEMVTVSEQAGAAPAHAPVIPPAPATAPLRPSAPGDPLAPALPSQTLVPAVGACPHSAAAAPAGELPTAPEAAAGPPPAPPTHPTHPTSAPCVAGGAPEPAPVGALPGAAAGAVEGAPADVPPARDPVSARAAGPAEASGCADAPPSEAVEAAPSAAASGTGPAMAAAHAGPAAPSTALRGAAEAEASAGCAAEEVAPAFPYNVEFRTENVLVSEVEERRGLPYDVVLCLKLTKWVHLYWGDDGLKVLFHKCFRLLRPGGVLVLEAQEWQSYQTSKQMTPHMRQNRGSLRLQPQEFTTYLVHAVGFSALESVAGDPPLKRPLLLFRRPLTSAAGDPAQQATERLLDGTQVVKAVLKALAEAKEADKAAKAPALDSSAGQGSAASAATTAPTADASGTPSQASAAPACTAAVPRPEEAGVAASVCPPSQPGAGGGGPPAGGEPPAGGGPPGPSSAARLVDATAGALDRTGETVPDSSTLPEAQSSGGTQEEEDASEGRAGATPGRAGAEAPSPKRLRTAE